MCGMGMKVGLAAGKTMCPGQARAGAAFHCADGCPSGWGGPQPRDAGPEAEIAAAPSLATDVRVVAKAAISTCSGEPKEELIQ